MKRINLLDCTLRDGGYINNWKFGKNPIRHISQLMKETGIEYFEVGFMRDIEYSEECSLYSDISQIAKVIYPRSNSMKYIGMIKLGEYPIEKLKPRESNSIDAIRVIFSKKDVDKAYTYCEQVQNQGYELFVQPVGTDKYTDIEFVEVIKKFNNLMPKAFYIVDTFGVIERKDLSRFLSLADNNLNREIALGYHSHNNLQQAYGNSQYMVELGFDRELFVDACIYGMGRGAGNLNTELFARYLNDNLNRNYNITPMLEIIDQYIGKILYENFWGYSLPYYLSAKNNCHPNYAKYFSEKNTLSNKSLNEILSSISEETKQSFSVDKAEQIYKSFQEIHVDDKDTLSILKTNLMMRDILILAPGSSLKTYKESIQKYIDNKKPVVISINVVNDNFKSDYVICTNEKRLRKIQVPENCSLITSSNLREADSSLVINYSSYLCNESRIADNPTIMLLNLLICLGVSNVSIAGFDGYHATLEDNYFEKDLALGASATAKLHKNKLIKAELERYRGILDIDFITPSLYV